MARGRKKAVTTEENIISEKNIQPVVKKTLTNTEVKVEETINDFNPKIKYFNPACVDKIAEVKIDNGEWITSQEEIKEAFNNLSGENHIIKYKFVNSINNIKIPEGFFTEIDNVKKVSLPKNNVIIGTNCFTNCKNLESIENFDECHGQRTIIKRSSNFEGTSLPKKYFQSCVLNDSIVGGIKKEEVLNKKYDGGILVKP